MSEYEVIKECLSKTGIYTIKDETLIQAEIKAYAAGLDMYFDMVNELLREMFVSTAEDYGLSEYEKMLNVCNIDKSVSGRRKSIISALSITKGDFTTNGIRKALGIFNIRADIVDDTLQRQYSFLYKNELTQEQLEILEKQLADYVPAWSKFVLRQAENQE